MAVAVKTTPESTTRSGLTGLAMASIVGALYVLGSIAVVTQAIPMLWAKGISPLMPPALSFVDTAGLILVLVFAVGVLVVFGMTLVGPNPPRGLRAGVFTVLVWLALTIWLASAAARFLGWMTGSSSAALAAMAIVAGGLIVWGWALLQRQGAAGLLERFENQGWFHADRYKATQGLRVRRATMLGLLVLLGSGVWVLHNHGTLYSAAQDWVLSIPYTDLTVTLLPDVAITLPIILAAAAFWVSYRLVNWPAFADFLIATEAEVNKISWASRKSVIQDTIVVLTTVFLFTVFLFLVDLLWGWVLSRSFVNVLRVTQQQPAATKQADQIDW